MTSPKPIRLTKARAEALIAAAYRGIDEWEAEIEDAVNAEFPNADEMRQARTMDGQRAAALDATRIVRARYVDHEPLPTTSHPTLFTD